MAWNIENIQVDENLDTNPELYKKRADAASDKGLYDEAIKEIDKALEYSNAALEYQYFRANILYKAERFEECRQYIMQSDLWQCENRMELSSMQWEKLFTQYWFCSEKIFPRGMGDDKALKYCPRCGWKLPKDANYCPNCKLLLRHKEEQKSSRIFDDSTLTVKITTEQMRNQEEIIIKTPQGKIAYKLSSNMDLRKKYRIKEKGYNNSDLYLKFIVKEML